MKRHSTTGTGTSHYRLEISEGKQSNKDGPTLSELCEETRWLRLGPRGMRKLVMFIAIVRKKDEKYLNIYLLVISLLLTFLTTRVGGFSAYARKMKAKFELNRSLSL